MARVAPVSASAFALTKIRPPRSRGHLVVRPALERRLAQALTSCRLTELAQNIAHAADQAEVAHVTWSTLEDTRERVPLHDKRMPTLMQRYKVPHFDAKGEADVLFRGLPTTFLRTAFYWDNLIHFGMGPQRGADGSLSFLLPMDELKLPGIAAADIGACAFGIFKDGAGLIGQTLGIAGEHLTGDAMSAELSAVLGDPVRHVTMPHAVYAQLGFPGAEDLANMFQYYCDFNEEFRGSGRFPHHASSIPAC